MLRLTLPPPEVLKYMIEGAPELMFVGDRTGHISYANHAFEELTGWPRIEWIGQHFSEILDPADIPRAHMTFQRAFEGHHDPLNDIRLRTRDGTSRTVRMRMTRLLEKGEVIGVFGLGTDVTERAEMELQMRETIRESALRDVSTEMADNAQDDAVIILMHLEEVRRLLVNTDLVYARADLAAAEDAVRRGVARLLELKARYRGDLKLLSA